MDTFDAAVFFPSIQSNSLERAPIPQEPAQYQDGYCRLCATKTHTSSLHSFAVSDASADGILASINRLNIGVNRGDGLPQVVCVNCVLKLQNVENFVQAATSAQSVLLAMFLPERLIDVNRSSPLECSDTSSGEEVFGGGKIKRERPKNVSERNVKKSIPEPVQSETKQPMVSSDPYIKRWSEFLCCKRCGFQTGAIQTLREHSWQSHSRCIVFKCVECVTGHVSTFKRFVRHMIKHHKTLEQCCEYCNGTFASEWDVILHKKHSHPEESHPNKCNRCGCSFVSELELQTHQDNYVIFQAKGVGDRRIKCKTCNKEFINYITLKSHMDSHDPSKNMCTICNKVYKSKYILSQHYNIVHTDQVRFICQICGKGFKMKTHLKRHMEIHNDVRRFPCDKCEKRFRTSSQLKSHLIAHSDESTFSCHLCSKSYKFHSGLKDHLRAHNNEKPYSCESCQRSFLSWSNYNKHMKTIHNRNMSKSGEKTLYQL